MHNEILSEVKGNALIVTFNRPEQGNAMTMDMVTQGFTILKNATTNPAVRAVLLRGNGGSFMTGLEMRLYSGDVAAGIERTNQMMQPYCSTIREIQAMEKPVLAVVEGNVGGPGMSFMLACDMVLAARSTKFNCMFTSYAMSPDGGASFFLTRKVGPVKAAELLMLSETFDAAEAERLHLVNAVVDDDKLHEESLRLIERLASTPTRAVGAVKTLVAKAFEQGLNQQLALEHAYWGLCSRTFDFREGIKAITAKRDPKYTGA